MGGGLSGGDGAARDFEEGDVVRGCGGGAWGCEGVLVVGECLRADHVGKGPFELGGGLNGGGDG